MGDWRNEFLDMGDGRSKKPDGPIPDNFHWWAVLAAFFCFFPTGIVAVSYSRKVEPLWRGGRAGEAQDAAAKARRWTIATLALGIVVAISLLMWVIYVRSMRY